METNNKYYFNLWIFNGKDTKTKKYKTLGGIEKRIGKKLPNALEPIFVGSNIIFEGSEGINKLTVFRELGISN